MRKCVTAVQRPNVADVVLSVGSVRCGMVNTLNASTDSFVR